jgi:GMP synthase (glutamine-hydrolysing)
LLCNAEPGKQVDPALQAKVREWIAGFTAPGAGKLEAEVLPVESVGVQGDARTYAHPCLVRGLGTGDAEGTEGDWERGDKLAVALTNRIREVNRVVLEAGALPGPYASVEAYCDRARLEVLRGIDALCTAFLYEENLYSTLWQMPVVLLPLEKSGKPVVVLRPVISSEAMTARFAPLPFPLLAKLWRRLAEAGIGSLLYDITHKPPGTIEWE